jgi:hypothetical protein
MRAKAVITAAFLALFGLNSKAPTIEQKNPLEERLYEIGMKSTTDNIERGGIISGQEVHELENEARNTPVLLAKYIEGANTNHSKLKGYLATAYSVRCTCNPELATLYTVHYTDLNSKLDIMTALSPEQRKKMEPPTNVLFGQFLPHGIYMTGQNQENTPNSIRFHTHPDGSPPSLQDIKNSHENKEYVVSATKEGDFTLYLVDKGEIKVVHKRR